MTHHYRPPARIRSRAVDPRQKETDEAFLLGFAALLALMLTVLVWSILHA